MTLSVIKTYSSDNIDEINKLLWEDITKRGNHIVFGDMEDKKPATEVFAVIQIYGKALSQLYQGKLPKGWKFGESSNQEYIKMLFNPDRGEQPYTYGERIHTQKVTISLATYLSKKGFKTDVRVPREDQAFIDVEINQIEEHRKMLKEAIETGVQTNRIWGDIGKSIDLKLKNPPCWRGWQLRTSERNKVSLRLVFRSNDATNAYMANLGAIIRVMVDEVINPAGGRLEEVILVATSEHIYDYDRDTTDSFLNKKNRWGLNL